MDIIQFTITSIVVGFVATVLFKLVIATVKFKRQFATLKETVKNQVVLLKIDSIEYKGQPLFLLYEMNPSDKKFVIHGPTVANLIEFALAKYLGKDVYLMNDDESNLEITLLTTTYQI